ncbi:MAG: WG repeat-containing protein [Bacteroidota bacterium]
MNLKKYILLIILIPVFGGCITTSKDPDNIFLSKVGYDEKIVWAESLRLFVMPDEACIASWPIYARKDSLWAILDGKGNPVTPVKFEELSNFWGSCNTENIIAKWDGKYGAINTNGETVIQAEYEQLELYFNDFKAMQNGKLGLINAQNEVILPFQFDYIQWWERNKSALVRKNSKWGVINTSLKEIIPFGKYDKIKPESIAGPIGHYAKVHKNNEWAIIELSGSMRTKFYDEIDYFTEEGLTGIVVDGNMGFVDLNDNLLIPPEYKPFTHDKLDVVLKTFFGWICLQKEGKYGFFDLKGNPVTPVKYDTVDFSSIKTDQTINFTIDGSKGKLDKNGKEFFR